MCNHKSNRFVDHPSFVFHCGNLIQRRESKSASVQYNKKYCGENDPSVTELLERAETERKQFLQSVHAHTSQIKGTDAFWCDVRNHCDAAIRHCVVRGRGLPSFFITSSCAEFHHTHLCRLVAEAVAMEKISTGQVTMGDGTSWETVSKERC